jgi:Cu/Ag efflux protein CusF
MRPYKVVILVNLALAVGFLVGSLWWAEELGRLRRELSTTQQALKARPAAEQRGTAQGFVRGVSPQKKLLYLTHEDIPGVMPSMTMGFRTEDPRLARGLAPGDQVQFTVQRTGEGFTVIALRKEGESR